MIFVLKLVSRKIKSFLFPLRLYCEIAKNSCIASCLITYFKTKAKIQLSCISALFTGDQNRKKILQNCGFNGIKIIIYNLDCKCQKYVKRERV